MPVLRNQRHERFAQEIAKGQSATAAYETAGGKKNRRYASELGHRPDISARVAEILSGRERMHAQATAKAVERVALTKEWVLAKLIENAERALQARQATDDDGKPLGDFKYEGTVANRALELLGKELGMFIDRKEVRNVGEFDDISDLAELRRRLVERAEELGERDIAATLAGGIGEAGRQPH